MRPVTVIVPLPPSYRGGTEEYAYRVAELASRSLPVRLVTTRVRWGHDAHPLSIGEADLVVLPGFELLERPLVLSAGARKTLRKIVSESSLVHLHMPFPMVERWVSGWAHRAGVPLVLTYHMDAEVSGRGIGTIARSLYRSWSARPALAGASAVVSNSLGYARASPVLSGYLPKVRVIPKGVDPGRLGVDRTEPVIATTLGLPPDSALGGVRKVVFVGRLVPYKGIPVLLEAMQLLARDSPAAHLYLAGRGPEEAHLRRVIAERGLNRQVTFLGFVPDDRIGPLYRWADVVACPSISTMESTPTSLEEAASLGTPVLGSNLPGAAETIPSDGIHGLLVPPGDAIAVAAGLRRLLSAPHWTPDRVRTWSDVAEDYLQLYRSLSRELPVPGVGSASDRTGTPPPGTR
jgi:glycosyltransferase involved in cell wall biosynthesis